MSLSESIGFRRDTVNGGFCLSFVSNTKSNAGESSSNPSGSSIYPSFLVKRFDHTFSASKVYGVVHELFHKELTSTDVGKSDRLNLPKMSALEYFPDISGGGMEESRLFNDMEIAFYDMSMKLWKFRFVYWKKSGLFALTKGWCEFVKEKKLQAKDTIIFSLCANDVSLYRLIDVCYFERLENQSGSNSEVTAAVDSAFPGNKEFRLFGVPFLPRQSYFMLQGQWDL